MGFTTTKAALVAASLIVVTIPGARAAAVDWQPVVSSAEKIEIDRSRISDTGNGKPTAWSRLNTLQAAADTEGKYNIVEALNQYNCADKHFATLKRLYLFDNTLIRAEKVLTPRQLEVTVGSMEATILSDLCKPFLQKASLAEEAAMAVREIIVADHSPTVTLATAARESAPSALVTQHRFITLPTIDPSQIQHPTDEPRPPEPTTGSTAKSNAPAIKTEAAKAGVALDTLSALRRTDRHARELALATSGPRKRAASATNPADEFPLEVQRHDIPWRYEGEGAPANWAKLRPDFGQCASGLRQSPIDIRDGVGVDLEPVQFNYHPSQFRIVDNGHTVQVSFGEGNGLTVMGRRYSLKQLHFHRPSEERVDGHGFEMVMHMVHKDEEGHLAVVAVLLERGPEHPVIQTFWNNLPLETDTELAPATAIDPNKLLPEARAYYTYMGSLTEPPCTEGVMWIVLKQPLQVSSEQIAIFSRLYPNNARPIQEANGRLIKGSR